MRHSLTHRTPQVFCGKRLAVDKKIVRIGDMDKKIKARIDELVRELTELYRIQNGEIGTEVIENNPIAKARVEAGLCVWCEKPIGNDKGRRGCHLACARMIDRRIDAGEFADENDAVRKGAWTIKSKVGPKFRPRPATVDERATEIANTNQVSKRRKLASSDESKPADPAQG